MGDKIMKIDKITQELIEKHIADFDMEGKENFVNIIAAAAEYGVEYVLELRNVLKNADIDISVFDEQLSKMLVGYKRIVDAIK